MPTDLLSRNSWVAWLAQAAPGLLAILLALSVSLLTLLCVRPSGPA